jgi:hypothetical protein
MRGNWPFFSREPFTMASMMLGWSEPRLTKTYSTPASHSASKKANEVVYILGALVVDVDDQRVCETALLVVEEEEREEEVRVLILVLIEVGDTREMDVERGKVVFP